MSTTGQTLTVNRLEYGFNAEALFRPLSFSLLPGRVTALLGRNGIGKSTLIRTLAGVNRPLAGTVNTTRRPGYVPQTFSVDLDYDVFNVVLMGRAAALGLFRQPGADDEAIVMDSLEELGIAPLAQRLYRDLSGGQQQLVMIARALATQCDTLLLDEPMSALDLNHQQNVMRLIVRLAQRGKSIFFSTHDPMHAHLTAQTTLMLMPEKAWLFGQTQSIVTPENLLAAFGVTIDTYTAGDGRALPVPLFDV